MRELHVLVPRGPEWDMRGKAVLRAVIEAAEELGAERIHTRRCEVYSIGVYLKEGDSKRLVYIDFDGNLSPDRIRSYIVSSAPRKDMEEYAGGFQVVF